MWKNKEWRRMNCLLVILCLTGSLVMSLFDLRYGCFLFLNEILLCTIFFLYTRKRYRKMQELSTYLQKIYQGKEDFDIRDYEEGELSILKSDIYKITRILSEQKDCLHKDKQFLASSLSDISHQLKTPLTSMFVMNELLKDEALPIMKRREFLGQMNAQLERIDWMVSSLLKLSKMDAATIVFKRDNLFLKQIITNSLEPLLIPMELRQISLFLECDEAVQMMGDRNWTMEALLNVIKNCIEHTNIGGELRILVKANPLHTYLEIQDNGCGIDPVDLPHIFERFYRGKNANKDSVGIGLAMTKAILLRQDARIEVTSVVNQGSCFKIYFYKL